MIIFNHGYSVTSHGYFCMIISVAKYDSDKISIFYLCARDLPRYYGSFFNKNKKISILEPLAMNITL